MILTSQWFCSILTLLAFCCKIAYVTGYDRSQRADHHDQTLLYVPASGDRIMIYSGNFRIPKIQSECPFPALFRHDLPNLAEINYALFKSVNLSLEAKFLSDLMQQSVPKLNLIKL